MTSTRRRSPLRQHCPYPQSVLGEAFHFVDHVTLAVSTPTTCSMFCPDRNDGGVYPVVVALVPRGASPSVIAALEPMSALPIQLLAALEFDTPALTRCSMECLDNDASKNVSMLKLGGLPPTAVTSSCTGCSMKMQWQPCPPPHKHGPRTRGESQAKAMAVLWVYSIGGQHEATVAIIFKKI